jgi:hypothetical protein
MGGLSRRIAMSEQVPTPPPDVAKVQADLQDVIQRMRTARHLDPSLQQRLADLLEELRKAIQATPEPSAELLHVAQSAAQLAQHLHRQEKHGMLASAKAQLQRTIAHAEVEAPRVTDLARRLIDALANIGI